MSMSRAWTEGSLGGLVAYLKSAGELLGEAGTPVVPGVPTVGSVGYSWCPPSSDSDGILSLTCNIRMVTAWYQIENEERNQTHMPCISEHGIMTIL